ncbi:hypothetical protein NC653_035788 [Populus alba x Populus x berolinensis]|uniref:Uncharacterized protein n=1 Tax=Populus alba x Populus x berolinensis TaxID=444605 RepID=A0AAD6PTY4_9ROSI|nr:hypothetical protein NC653_035788 [Populus alba x Populus x berolinensis]
MKEACINPDVFTCNSLIAGAMRHCLLSKFVGALVKTCRIEEPSHYMERMVNTGIGIEMTSYNAPINLNCKGSKLEVACEILDEMDKV